MATSKHTLRTKLNVGIDYSDLTELELAVDFTYWPATPATMMSPGECARVEIQEVRAFWPKTLTPIELPSWMTEAMADNQSLQIQMEDCAEDERKAEEDEAADFRRRQARDDAMTGV